MMKLENEEDLRNLKHIDLLEEETPDSIEILMTPPSDDDAGGEAEVSTPTATEVGLDDCKGSTTDEKDPEDSP